jgi:ABC-type glutathione transport system ATPase component
MTRVLEARQLAKTYETGGTKVLGLRGVDISVDRGEFVAIMGRAGAGSRRCSICLLDSIGRRGARCGSMVRGSTA